MENEDVPLYSELKEKYLSGEIIFPKEKGWVLYHLNEHRKSLGIKYAMWSSCEEFIKMIELGKELEKKQFEFLWKVKE